MVVLRLSQEATKSGDTINTEVPCHSGCGTIKIPPCSQTIGAELIDCLLFDVPFENISLINCDVTIPQISALLSAYGLWSGRDLYRAILALYGTSGYTVSSEGPPLCSRLLQLVRGTEDHFCNTLPAIISSQKRDIFERDGKQGTKSIVAGCYLGFLRGW